MEQSGKKKKIIAIVVLCVLALTIVGLVSYNCGKRKIEKQHEYVEFYVRFIDRTTEKTYNATRAESREVRVPYDGLEHTFSYEVYTIKGKKCKESRNISAYANKTVKEPGQYSFYVTESVNGHSHDFRMVFIIEQKLQPEMIFEPNGAIDYIDGEYYKYKFTTEYRYPLAYVEYEGTRLHAVGEPPYIAECYPDYYSSNVSVLAPRRPGKYTTIFVINRYTEDPDSKIYYSVEKTIIIEIVE